ncbi:receptor-like protein 43 [Eucalyptus grandis]|uniref:receptor-like protein 43 n=1 Tax=Eucalyptus grandis TaxID=71139 RepID=UPI00192EB51D|nr:receptor-like protein 43 [Eucalyptus grandis]
MNGSIISWLLAISTISIYFDVVGASASAQCLSVDQRSLLLELRKSLVFNASKSSKLVQWDRSASSWSGVTCEDSLVVGLDLSNESISGGINGSSSLFKLEFLRSLNLAFNDFDSSAIPFGLANLSRLVHLNLSYAGFAGQIPVDLSRLTKLRTLDLSGLYFIELPLLKLKKPSLRSLIGNLGELRELYLDKVDVSAEGSFETPPSNLTSVLSVIDLHANMLRGNVLPLLSYALYLDFSSNNITSVIPDNIGGYLSMTGFFSLSKNNFHGSIPKSVCKAHYLEVLDLSHNNLNGTIPDCLMMASLNVLNLRNNQLNGDIPQNILGTCGLKTLDLSENLLQGQIPLSLAGCTMLEVMNIGNNKIDGTFPCHLKAISSLCVLVLRSNKLHGEIGCPQSPSIWQKLQIIDLSSNNIGGILPASLLTSWEAMKANVELVKILTVFTSIDFSSNRLEGPIPDTIGDLKALYFLNLSHNAISGSIPPVLGNLHQLESLDLSWNYLNGSIPAQLVNLDFLSFLNLSNNQLVGSIPTS